MSLQLGKKSRFIRERQTWSPNTFASMASAAGLAFFSDSCARFDRVGGSLDVASLGRASCCVIVSRAHAGQAEVNPVNQRKYSSRSIRLQNSMDENGDGVDLDSLNQLEAE